MSNEKDIEWYKNKLKEVRIQRNEYEILLREAEKKLSEFKTPAVTLAHGHRFLRYLMSNEFAEEMKCNCGYTIWPCKTEEEVTAAMISISGDIVKCKRYPKIHTQ